MFDDLGRYPETGMNKQQKFERQERVKAKREKHQIVARALSKGKTQVDACRAAGYSEATAQHHSKEVCQLTKGVREALFEIAGRCSNREVSDLASARIIEAMTDGYSK